MTSDLIERTRASVQQRVELPGMSLMEHLEELRRRIIWSLSFLFAGFVIAYIFHVKLYDLIQRPVTQLGLKLNFTHPTDGLNLYLKTSLLGGAIIAAPFILYQLWLFIAPGLYHAEKKYVWPFMASTIGLFLSGVWFGYRYVLPGEMHSLAIRTWRYVATSSRFVSIGRPVPTGVAAIRRSNRVV
jgi:sec-independent protein translocase protein TatC